MPSSQDFHLILAGSGEPNYLKELQDLALSLFLGSRVSFPGFVKGYDQQLLPQGADLCILPSFSENFGLAVAEAMSQGLPVILTPGVQIAAARAGLVVLGAAALANAIAKRRSPCFPKFTTRISSKWQALKLSSLFLECDLFKTTTCRFCPQPKTTTASIISQF